MRKPATPYAPEQIERRSPDDLIPYVNNARVHSDEQISQIAASVREFGWTNPILINADNTVIAGHGRLAAAKKLKLTSVPVIVLDHLSKAQQKALIIADNKLALNASWNEQLLAAELQMLDSQNFDLGVIGFSNDELNLLFDEDDAATESSKYTHKIEAPTYTPMGPKPEITTLYDQETARTLIAAIQASTVTEDEKAFLLAAAARHIVFDFQNIAEYYAHASAECQKLMEDSALVIIDFERAIELGYTALSEKISEIYAGEKQDAA